MARRDKRSARGGNAEAVRVIGYCRVSTDEQVNEGVSLTAQEEKIRAYCQLHSLTLVHVQHEDKGLKSAKTLDRKVLQSVLSDLDRGVADGIVVAKLDRLTRRMRDWTDLLENRFVEGGSLLYSVNEHVETRTAGGRFMLNMLMSVAQWERETIAERTSDALQHLARQGYWNGGRIPYGWRPGPRVVGEDGRRQPRSLVPDDEEQKVVAEACRLRFEEGLSLRQVCRELTEQGYRPRKGREWYPQAVIHMTREREAG